MSIKIVRSIQVNPDSVDLAYMDDGDVRLRGAVFQTHHLSISRGSNFDDEIDALEAAAEALLMDVLVDFEASPAFDPTQAARERYAAQHDDDDDDD